MRWSRSWVVAVVLAAMPGTITGVHAFADGDAAVPVEAREFERDVLERLRSPDETVRAKAAADGVAGHRHVRHVARGLADAGDDAWTSFAAACTKEGSFYDALELAAAARFGPEAHRVRVLELARRIDPQFGAEHGPEVLAERVRAIFEAGEKATCLTGFEVRLARLGHGAVPVILARLRESGPKSMMDWVAQYSLDWIAEASDVPALRELLFAGFSELPRVLAEFAKEQNPEASEALLAAVAAGRFDKRLAEALESVPDRARTVEAVRSWIGTQKEPSADVRCAAARLYAALGARDLVPAVESWLDAATQPDEFVAFGTSLTRLGSGKGVETLVRMIGDAEDDTKPRDPSPLVLPPRGGKRMCLRGFDAYERWRAADALDAIAGRVVFPRVDPDAPPTAPGKASPPEARLALAAIAYRAWWDASKDKLVFDPTTGKWTAGE